MGRPCRWRRVTDRHLAGSVARQRRPPSVTASRRSANCSYTSASATPYVLTASATGLTSATASTTVSAGPAAKVIVWSGNSQSAKINTAFAQPLSGDRDRRERQPGYGCVGKVHCSGWQPVRKICQCGELCCTNAQGIATSSTLTAGTTAGTYAPTATVDRRRDSGDLLRDEHECRSSCS